MDFLAKIRNFFRFLTIDRTYWETWIKAIRDIMESIQDAFFMVMKAVLFTIYLFTLAAIYFSRLCIMLWDYTIGFYLNFDSGNFEEEIVDFRPETSCCSSSISTYTEASTDQFNEEYDADDEDSDEFFLAKSK